MSLRGARFLAILSFVVVPIAAASAMPVLFEASFETYQVGFTPGPVIVEDFDGDGVLDVLLADLSGQKIDIMSGLGNARFADPLQVDLTTSPLDIVVADMNGDDDLDLVVSHGIDEVSILFGNGDGTFAAPTALSTTSSPIAIAVGGNHHGRPKIAVINESTNQVTVYIYFASPVDLWLPITSLSTGLDARDVAIADLNGDTLADVIVVSGSPPTLSVFFGNGDTSFAAAVNFGTVVNPAQITIADFDNNTTLDVLVTSRTTPTVRILPGNGDGTFGPAILFQTAGGSGQALAVDWNDDELLDLVIANEAVNTASLHINTGGATFGPGVQIAAQGPRYVAAADVNSDGEKDVLIANTGDVSFAVHTGNGNGSFDRPVPQILANTPGTKYATTLNLNADTRIDFAISSAQTGTISLVANMGDGNFTKIAELLSADPRAVEAAQLDDDVWPDLAVAGGASGALEVFMGVGPGTFSSPIIVPLNIDPDHLLIVDLNNDNALDVALTGNEFVTTLLGDGLGGFGPSVQQTAFSAGSVANSLHFGDFDEDNANDLLAADRSCCPGYYSVLLGNNDGTLQAGSATSPCTVEINEAKVANLDNDTHDDIVTFGHNQGTASRRAIIFQAGMGDGSFAQATFRDGVDTPLDADVADFDGDGNVDLAVADEHYKALAIFLGRGDGTFQHRLGYGVGFFPTFVLCRDVDFDGDIDLLVGGDGPDDFTLLFNQTATPTDVGPRTTPGNGIVLASPIVTPDGVVRLRYKLDQSSDVRLAVFDVRGRLVRVVHEGVDASGEHERLWKVADRDAQVARGVYFVQLRSQFDRATQKLTLIR